MDVAFKQEIHTVAPFQVGVTRGRQSAPYPRPILKAQFERKAIHPNSALRSAGKPKHAQAAFAVTKYKRITGSEMVMADVSVIGTSSSIDGFSCDGPQQAGENEMGGNYQKARMLSQEQASTDGCDWHRTVLGNIKARLVDDQEFPCIFGRSAIRKGILKFIFVESVDPAGIRHLADGLVEYVECSKGWDGNLNTASPLVVAFSLDAIRDGSWADYHAFGWSVLQKLHEIDPMPWPQDVATDPHSPAEFRC